MKPRTTIINGIAIEHLDVIHSNSTTTFSFKDRLRILFGSTVRIETEIFTGHEDAKVLASRSKPYVAILFPRKQQGGGECLTAPITDK